MSNRAQKWNVGPEHQKERETFCGCFGKRTPFLRLRAQLKTGCEPEFNYKGCEQSQSLPPSSRSKLTYMLIHTYVNSAIHILFLSPLHIILKKETSMTQILDGKALAGKIREELKHEVQQLSKSGVTPSLTVILVGEDPASQVYVRNKERAATEVGIHSNVIRLSEETTQEELLEFVNKLNHDASVHGILVQLPLPKHIDTDAVLEAIVPEKDVDGFHPVNLGKLLQKDESIVPCTPQGIMEFFKEYNIYLVGKEMVIIGQSTIVGRPMALLGLNHGATVTVCHSRTKDLAKVAKRADILISAVGKAGLVTKDFVKEGAVVIDVGINRNEEGKLCGDVLFEEVAPLTSAITPVPGGVGPMTIAMLLAQTVKNAKSKKE